MGDKLMKAANNDAPTNPLKESKNDARRAEQHSKTKHEEHPPQYQHHRCGKWCNPMGNLQDL